MSAVFGQAIEHFVQKKHSLSFRDCRGGGTFTRRGLLYTIRSHHVNLELSCFHSGHC